MQCAQRQDKTLHMSMWHVRQLILPLSPKRNAKRDSTELYNLHGYISLFVDACMHLQVQPAGMPLQVQPLQVQPAASGAAEGGPFGSEDGWFR